MIRGILIQLIMPSTSFHFNESDVIKLILEFLQHRTLNISLLSLERESGVVNGIFSDDMLFLRQLILDGQWNDCIDFIQPLSSISLFDSKSFQYIINKHKFIELLCLKSEPGLQDHDSAVDELVKCLNTLESLCPSKEEYSKLCFLLTIPRLSEHPEFENWNPSNARVQCFMEIYPLVEKFLPVDKHDKRAEESKAQNDRLLQLVIKVFTVFVLNYV